MITSLSIKNYALIDQLSVDFGSGFTVITGETGAGKSIVLGALGLLLGQRADLDSVKNKTLKSVIEGHFDLSRFKLRSFFKQHDLDFETETIIRRELLPSGKSRAFINDTPVTLGILSTLGDTLIDIHSQLQQLEVNTTAFKFNLLDQIAGNSTLLNEYREALKAYKKSQKELENLELAQAAAAKEFDYNKYLLEELEQVQLDTVDELELDLQYETLSNVERIQELLSEAAHAMADDQIGAGNQIRLATQQLAALAKISPRFEPLFERLQSVQIELTDIEEELFGFQESIERDPQKLATLENLTRSLYDLKRKHAAGSIEELIAQREQLAAAVNLVSNQGEALAAAEQLSDQNLKRVKALSAQLHKNRKGIIPELNETVNSQLSALGMPNARFIVEQNILASFTDFGGESVEFYFSANKGVAPGLLQKTASGGELSRVLLALKALLAKHANLATLIFDEIDTGVSGEIANRIATIMQQMAHSMQLISITHLPQVAAKGRHHYKVFKSEKDGVATTQMSRLTEEERVVEIAQMLGGQQLSETALNHAKELLN